VRDIFDEYQVQCIMQESNICYVMIVNTDLMNSYNT
jgi:hypothetical protein